MKTQSHISFTYTNNIMLHAKLVPSIKEISDIIHWRDAECSQKYLVRDAQLLQQVECFTPLTSPQVMHGGVGYDADVHQIKDGK